MMRAAILLCLLAAQSAKPGPLASEWHQYRGPNRDGHSPDTGLLKQWPSGGPPLAWKATGVGSGYSSVSIVGNRIFTMGEAGGSCNLVALNAADGKIAWSVKVGDASSPGGYAGPRSTPATDGILVFAIGQSGDLVCAQAATGRVVWKVDFKKNFGGKMMSGWGYSESPLLDGNLVVCTPGGQKGTVVALNKATGAPVWQSAELKDSAAYASLVPAMIGGVRQYVVLTDTSVAGIAAANGRVAWRADRKGETAVIPTPVVSKEGIVFVASGYGVGCNAFQISNQFKAQPLYSGKQMVNHHGGLILVGDHLYGTDESKMKCIELKTGKVAWEERCVGKGSVGYADGHLVVRSEGGPIALVEATPTGYKEKGRFDQPDRSRQNSWPHPVIFKGKLYIRDQDVLLCYDVQAK